MENTGLSNLNTLLVTPAKDTSEIIAKAIRDGDANAVEAGLALKKFKKLHDNFFDSKSNKNFKDVKEIIEDEILKHQEGSKTFTIYGTKITEASRGYWDYSQTDDPLLNGLKEVEKEIKQRIKLREEYLQNKAHEYELNNKPKDIVEFGIKPYTIEVTELPSFKMEEAYAEVITNPPVKRNTTSLRFSV